ncbi:MAG: hypothetical protein H5T34_03625 [Candidatus Methanomethyliales bacterium]|nr:hypothetical protein [Candidatus Methanomethylicales archaeon]
MEEVRPTIKGKLILGSPSDRGWLLLLMRNFKDAIEYAHSLMKEGLSHAKIVKLLTSRILNNAHYSHSALQRAKLYKEQPYLKLKKPQLFSVGKRCEKGNRNIRFLSTDAVNIKVPSAIGRHKWLVVKVRFGERYIQIIEQLINSKFPYGAGIYLKGERFELHVSVPMELYRKYLNKVSRFYVPCGHIASFDFNPDRANMVIVDREGNLLDAKTEYFPEVTSQGFPKEKGRDVRMKVLVRLVDYAHHHGVTDYIIERLSKPKTKTASKVANRKIANFALHEYVEHMRTLIPRYSGRLHVVGSIYASMDAIPLSKKLGLDIHTTSAYLLAIRSLKSVNGHQCL